MPNSNYHIRCRIRHDDERHGGLNSSAHGKSREDGTFIADSNVTGCDKCGCNKKVESKTTDDDEPNNTPPAIGSSVFCDVSPPLISRN